MGLKSRIKNYFKRRKRIDILRKEFFAHRKDNVFPLEQSLEFDASDQPILSIIVAVSKNPNLNFLHFLKKSKPQLPYEILLAFEEASDVESFRNIAGLSAFSGNSNFIKTINQTILKSKSDILYLVSDKLNINGIFLDELFSTFNALEDCGILASQLEHDNTVIDGLIFQQNLHFSETKSVYHPDVNYVRQVDYVPDMSFMVKKLDANGEVIQFDSSLNEIDSGIVDFCMKTKFEYKQNIWVTPFSRAVSDHSQKSRDISFKDIVFRWKSELSSIEEKTTNTRTHALQGKKTAVLFCKVFPEHDRDSGSNRLKEIIFALRDLNFFVTIVSKDTFSDNAYLKMYQKKGVRAYYNFDKNVSPAKYLESQTMKPEFVWFYGPNVFHEFYKPVQNIFPDAKLVYDMVDIHHLRFERAMELEPKRISLRKKYKFHKKIEINASKIADYVIAISDFEEDYMSDFCDGNKIKIISNLHYPKIEKRKTLSFGDRKDILFIGSTHAPNIDSIYYLYREIMPLVWKILPDLKVNIIGNVNEVIKDIDHPNIIFLGYVPDVESLFISNKLMVAPLRYGAGVKGKIGQALEYYLPTVTSTIGAEGMKLTDRENTLIEDSPEGFAKSIIELYTNEELWKKLQDNSEESLKPFSIESLKNTILSLSK